LLPAAIGQTMELAQTHNHFTLSLLISSYWSAVAIGLEAMVGFLRCDFYPFIMPVRGRVFFQAHFYLSFTRCMPLRSYLTCFRLFLACNKKATVWQIPAAGEAVGWPQSLNSHRPIWAPRDVPFDLLGYAKLISQTPKTPLFIVLYRRFPWLQVQLSVANFSWTFVILWFLSSDFSNEGLASSELDTRFRCIPNHNLFQSLVPALHHHLTTNPNVPADTPLFAFEADDGGWEPFTQLNLFFQCNEIWVAAGFAPFKAHALRIGGCTALHLHGTNPGNIRVQRCWKSRDFGYLRNFRRCCIFLSRICLQPLALPL
jgi:hypothetical protein